MHLFTGSFSPNVCLFVLFWLCLFLFYFISFLDACFFPLREIGKVWIWEVGEDVERVEGGKTYLEHIVRKTSIFSFKNSDPVLPIDFPDYCDLFCWGLCFCVLTPCVQLMNHFRPSMKSDWYLYLHQQIRPRRKEAVGVCTSSSLMSQCCEQLLASSTKRIVLKFLCYSHFNGNRHLQV